MSKNVPDQEQIDHWLNVSRSSIERAWKNYNSDFYKKNNVPIQSHYCRLGLNHASVARAMFLNGDSLPQVRDEFAKASQANLKSFTMTYDESDPDYKGLPTEFGDVTETIAIDAMSWALMAADFELAADMASWWRDSPDGDMLSVDTNRYTHALAYILRDMDTETAAMLALQFADYARKPPKSKADRNYHSLITALQGILDKDDARFNEGLAAHLQIYESVARGEVKNTDEEFICDWAVALANLALHRGLNVTVTHDTLPPGLLIQS